MSGSVRTALARIQEALDAGVAPSPVDMQMLRSINADTVHGTLGSPGGLDNVRRLIVEFARRFGLNSLQLREKLRRYETSAWRRGERADSECPTRRAGHPEEFCWEILRIYGRTPTDRTIRRMLDAQGRGQINRRDVHRSPR